MRKPLVDHAASVRARLLAYAKAKGLAFELVLTRYALERLLDRLARSPYQERFVLKGGMLVTIWFDDPIRATRDLDLLGFGDPEPDRVRATFAEVMAMPADDPLAFDTASLSVAPIRDADQYGGIRLRTVATLANARIPVVVDVAFGDAVEPRPLLIDYPVLLDGVRPKIRAYAPETVIAEKFQAMVRLGRANSRMKDLYDVWSLLRFYDLDREGLSLAIRATFARRGTPLPEVPPDVFTEAFAKHVSKLRQWRAFVDDLTTEAPSLSTVVSDLAEHLMPLVADARSNETRAAHKETSA